MDKKRLAILAAIPVLTIIGIVFLFIPKDDNKPTESKVPQGETITPQGSGSSNNGQLGTPSTTPTPSAPLTTDQFTSVIEKSAPYLASKNNQPQYGITKTIQPLAGWYVVTISLTNGGQPEKVIVRQTGDPNNPVTVVAGPGTSFPPEFIQLPDAVRKALK